MSRFVYDTEFIDDGTTIELISIGIVSLDDDREYYAVNSEVQQHRIIDSKFLRENVWPSLPTRKIPKSVGRTIPFVELGQLDPTHEDVKPKSQIAEEVRDFLLQDGPVDELWAYYAAYDHVALAQLFGAMIDLPSGVPMFSCDLQQEAHLHKVTFPEQAQGNHNALADARFNKVRYETLRKANVL